MESNIVINLNPESQIDDTSWIHPGQASWDWWSGSLGPQGKPAFTTATMKYYVDFAAKSGFEYMLVDAGWSARRRYHQDERPRRHPRRGALCRPARTSKSGSGCTRTARPKQMDEAFPLYEKWGVAGVKIDFIERDDQAGIDFYYRAAELAARASSDGRFPRRHQAHRHRRTWPNVLGL